MKSAAGVKNLGLIYAEMCQNRDGTVFDRLMFGRNFRIINIFYNKPKNLNDFIEAEKLELHIAEAKRIFQQSCMEKYSYLMVCDE